MSVIEGSQKYLVLTVIPRLESRLVESFVRPFDTLSRYLCNLDLITRNTLRAGKTRGIVVKTRFLIRHGFVKKILECLEIIYNPS